MRGYFASLSKRLKRAHDDTTTILTYRVRSFAKQSGVDEGLANRLHVEYHDKPDKSGPSGYRVTMRQAADGDYEKLRDSEYGFSGDPNPALHRLRNRMPEMIKNASIEALSSDRNHPRGLG